MTHVQGRTVIRCSRCGRDQRYRGEHLWVHAPKKLRVAIRSEARSAFDYYAGRGYDMHGDLWETDAADFGADDEYIDSILTATYGSVHTGAREIHKLGLSRKNVWEMFVDQVSRIA